MLTLFTVPDSATIVSNTSDIVAVWVPQYMPVVYWMLGIVVFTGAIILIARSLINGAHKVFNHDHDNIEQRYQAWRADEERRGYHHFD